MKLGAGPLERDAMLVLKVRVFLIIVTVVGVLACGQIPTSTPSLPTPSPIPAASRADLWYLLRGDVKADQAWGVDVDTFGNVYLAAFEQKPDQWFTDMSLYKFAPDGQEIWHTGWGGQFQEKAFIVDVAEPYVYVGGLTHTGMGLTEADMAVLALDMDTGQVLWEFTWGQGFGYEEVDGLVVDGKYIYISGWTTSEETGYDLAVLKLDLQGNRIWESVWGTDGFDTADGQMVLAGDSIYVSGRVNGATMLTGGQALVTRFSRETGEYLQHVTWGDSAFADGLGTTSDGVSLYVIGMRLTMQGNQVFLLKYDQDLNLLWERLWGDVRGEHTARAGAVDAAGNILLAVNSRLTPTSPTDVYLLKFSPDGQLLWESRWGGEDEEVIHGVVVDGDYIYLAGEIKFREPAQIDALLIKADSQIGQFPPR